MSRLSIVGTPHQPQTQKRDVKTIPSIMARCQAMFFGKTIVQTEFGYYRSEMCKDWTAGRVCKFGAHCHYAHGCIEICPKPYEDWKFKVKQCTCQNRFVGSLEGINFQKNCSYGSRCEWRHDEMLYVLKDPNLGLVIGIYYSEEEDRYRISLKPDIFESKIYVISLVRPQVRDPMFEEILPYLEAAKRLVQPQNPCEYFSGTHPQSKCRIVGLETISTNPLKSSGGHAVIQQPSTPVNLTPIQPLLNFQSDNRYIFPASVLTPPSGIGYYPVYQNHMQMMPSVNSPFTAVNMQTNLPLMTQMPQFTMPDETYVMYNPDSNISDTDSWTWAHAAEQRQTGEDNQYEKASQAGVQYEMTSPANVQYNGLQQAGVQYDGRQQAGMQFEDRQQAGVQYNLTPEHNVFTHDVEMNSETLSPVNCLTPENNPDAGRTFMTTPTRVSTAPPGYPNRRISTQVFEKNRKTAGRRDRAGNHE